MRCCVFKGNYPPLQTGCKSANTSSIDNDIWCQYITTVRIYEIWYIWAWKPWRSKQIHCTLSKGTCMFPNYSHPAGEETRPCVPEMSTMPTLSSQSDHYSNQRNYDHQQIQYRQCHDRGHVQVWWLPRENLKRIANHKLKMLFFQWVTEILYSVIAGYYHCGFDDFSWGEAGRGCCIIFYIIFLKEIGWNFELRPFWYWNLELSHFWQLRARKEN